MLVRALKRSALFSVLFFGLMVALAVWEREWFPVLLGLIAIVVALVAALWQERGTSRQHE